MACCVLLRRLSLSLRRRHCLGARGRDRSGLLAPARTAAGHFVYHAIGLSADCSCLDQFSDLCRIGCVEQDFDKIRVCGSFSEIGTELLEIIMQVLGNATDLVDRCFDRGELLFEIQCFFL